jgi:hypothetical protein
MIVFTVIHKNDLYAFLIRPTFRLLLLNSNKTRFYYEYTLELQLKNSRTPLLLIKTLIADIEETYTLQIAAVNRKK